MISRRLLQRKSDWHRSQQVQFGKLLYQLTTSIEDAQREQRRGSVIKKGSKEKKQKDYQELLDPKNITDPDVKTPPPLTREEATDLLFIVHWWGNLGCVSAIDSVDSESMKKALEAIVAKEDDIFISHHQSPSWYSELTSESLVHWD